MTTTVEINDKSFTGQRIIKDLRHNMREINFVEQNDAPEGYMTVEEFRKEAKTSLTKILNEHGIY